MNFSTAIKKLNIEEYGERILNSNSHGELFYILDYIFIAENIKEVHISTFKLCFVHAVKQAEKSWDRPESIFQHIFKIIGAKETQ